MLIAIGVLIVVAIVMANKSDPASQTPLPPPSPVPATGTWGVPSPAQTMNPLLGTNAGQLIAQTNYTLSQVSGMRAPAPLPSPATISNAPLGPPSQGKNLVTTTPTASPLMEQLNPYAGMRRL
jgi:hypothetical protein